MPWPGGGGGCRWQDSYNYFQSSCHVHIEQAFGILVWRWGVFWRPLRVPVLMPSLIRASFKLHNNCRRYACAEELLAPFDMDSVGGSVYFCESDGAQPGERARRRGLERSHLRWRMTDRLEELGVLRPDVDPMY